MGKEHCVHVRLKVFAFVASLLVGLGFMFSFSTWGNYQIFGVQVPEREGTLTFLLNKFGSDDLSRQTDSISPNNSTLSEIRSSQKMGDIQDLENASELTFCANCTKPGTSLHVADPSRLLVCHEFSTGRLGNHLFEYACTLALAANTNRTFFLTRESERLRHVLKYPPLIDTAFKTDMSKRCHEAGRLKEKASRQYDASLFAALGDRRDHTVAGYLQSWRYLHVLSAQILQAVQFTDAVVAAARRAVDAVRRSRNDVIVGVHNRRGDLTMAFHQNGGYVLGSKDYFFKAFKFFREKFPGRARFLVLGEDRKWSQENLAAGSDDVAVPQPDANPAVDMETLARCDHVIITSGSFGWWAAYKLTGRRRAENQGQGQRRGQDQSQGGDAPIVVRMKNFATPGSNVARTFSADAQDHYPKEWIAL